MKMRVQIDRSAGALQEGDGAAVCLAHLESLSCSPLQGGEDGLDEDAQHLAAQRLVEGEAVTKGEGERQHVLAYRNLGEDAVDQVRRGVGHAAGSAGRAESSHLAGKGDQPLSTALLAADAEKAVGEDSTGEIGPELALDEAGNDAALVAGGGEEGLEVVLHHAVENGLLGCAPLVLQRIGQLVRDEDLARHGRKLMRAACLRRDAPSGHEKAVAGPGVIVRLRPGRDEVFTGCRSPSGSGSVRCELAHPCPPYVIASDRTLREIALLRPRNLHELELAHGIGPARREKYGAGLLDVVLGGGTA